MFKSIESLDGDRGVDRRHYAVPFKGILIRSTPEIVLSSKQNKLQESEDERRAKLDDKLLQGMNSLVFNGNHFPNAVINPSCRTTNMKTHTHKKSNVF